MEMRARGRLLHRLDHFSTVSEDSQGWQATATFLSVTGVLECRIGVPGGRRCAPRYLGAPPAPAATPRWWWPCRRLSQRPWLQEREHAVDDMHGEGQGKGRPQEGLIHWLVVAAGCCWAGSTQSATGPLAGPAAGSVSCQIPSALYNPSHDLFRSAAVQSYSPPASSDVSSESTLQYTVV